MNLRTITDAVPPDRRLQSSLSAFAQQVAILKPALHTQQYKKVATGARETMRSDNAHSSACEGLSPNVIDQAMKEETATFPALESPTVASLHRAPPGAQFETLRLLETEAKPENEDAESIGGVDLETGEADGRITPVQPPHMRVSLEQIEQQPSRTYSIKKPKKLQKNIHVNLNSMDHRHPSNE